MNIDYFEHKKTYIFFYAILNCLSTIISTSSLILIYQTLDGGVISPLTGEGTPRPLPTTKEQ